MHHILSISSVTEWEYKFTESLSMQLTLSFFPSLPSFGTHYIMQLLSFVVILCQCFYRTQFFPTFFLFFLLTSDKNFFFLIIFNNFHWRSLAFLQLKLHHNIFISFNIFYMDITLQSIKIPTILESKNFMSTL